MVPKHPEGKYNTPDVGQKQITRRPKKRRRPPKVPEEPGGPSTPEGLGCTASREILPTERRYDVQVSSSWNDRDEFQQDMREKIERDGTWYSENIGTAVAVSRGADIGGSVSVGARVILLRGDQRTFGSTPEIEASASGRTEINVRVNAPENARTAISAAGLTVLEAHASVPRYPEELLTAGEATLTLVGLFQPGVADAGEIGIRLLSNADVYVEARGAMRFVVGDCENSNGEISATARRTFRLEGLTLLEPASGLWYELDTPGGLASCSVTNDMRISFDGEAHVRGRALESYIGEAQIISLWAAGWIWECREERQGEVVGNRGFEAVWGGRIILPPDVQRELSREGLDSDQMGRFIQSVLDMTIEEKMREADGNAPSPIDDPEGAEAAIRAALLDWLEYVGSEFGLFTEPYFDPPDEEQE